MNDRNVLYRYRKDNLIGQTNQPNLTTTRPHRQTEEEKKPERTVIRVSTKDCVSASYLLGMAPFEKYAKLGMHADRTYDRLCL